MPRTCLDETGLQIASALYRAAEMLGADPDLLAAIGSWGDTMDDNVILAAITSWNEMGESLHPDQDIHSPKR